MDWLVLLGNYSPIFIIIIVINSHEASNDSGDLKRAFEQFIAVRSDKENLGKALRV